MSNLPRAALLLLAPLLLLPPAAPAGEAGPRIEAHDLELFLDPATGGIEGKDLMTVARGGGGNLSFELRSELSLRLVEVAGRPLPALAREEADPRPGVARYRVPVIPGSAPAAVLVAWGGTILEKVEKAEDLAFVVGDHSRGTISPEGTFLSESTAWVPLDGSMATFAVRATLPEGWTVATQGGVPSSTTAEGRSTFAFPAGIPCDGLWLQAGKWTVERRTAKSGTSIATYLSAGNAGSSKLMLDSVEEYLGLYEKVLGPYPHAKFDIVENFFTTGYGMPTATLLGGDVIQHMAMMAQRAGGKIPPGYIDHELVHCWWGNGVFVDYGTGNWCEALTSYCSNYLRKEWESAEEGAKHRRGTRARFAARVAPSKDYPVRRFTGKTEEVDNDIGYGKGSMIFHTLRRAVGDEAFFGGLQDVVKEFTGKRASWDDFRRAFEKRSGRKLGPLMDPLLDRTGAPVIVLEGAAAKADAEGWQVTGSIVQRGDPWSLPVPLVLETAAGRETTTVDVAGERTPFTIRTRSVPLRVLLDPESECWRGFAPGEKPAMLDSALHDPAGLDCMTVPSPAGDPYAVVVEAVRARGAGVSVMGEDGSFDPPPAPPGERSVLVLGHLEDNPTLRAILGLATPPVRIDGKRVTVGGQRFEGEDIALLLSTRHPRNRDRTLTVYAGMSDAALAGARRIFFYGGDGIVVFKAGRPVLRIEAEGEGSSRAPLLDSLMPQADGGRAMALVEALCSKEVEGRLAGANEGAKAWEALAKEMGDAGLQVRVQDFSFTVATWDGLPSCDGPEKGARPMTFSGRADEPVDRDPAGQIMVGPETKAEELLAAVKAAVEKGAKLILVVGPPDVPKGIADYVFPLPRERKEGVPAPDPDLEQAGAQARAPLPVERLSIPAVYYPKPPERSALPAAVKATVGTRTVASVNLLVLIDGSDPALSGEAVLLGAHHDHLGPGFPGANDDASGVAAVLEAARVLAVQCASLRRPVVVALFGAEEWGLRGSRAFAAARPEGIPPVAAALTLDTVGQAGVPEVNVVGQSVYPGLAAVMARALSGAGLAKGGDIDRFAFAHGSDHYALHEAGIPAIDLFSAEYRLMHTPGDVLATVDGRKLASLARAAAAWAMSLSRDGLPPKETR